jgi:hypothetical protein
MVWVDDFWCVFCFFYGVLQYCCSVCLGAASSLTCATADANSNVVDVYNGATGAWTTAQLSVARCSLAAASVGNVALFAGGGSTASAFLFTEGEFGAVYCCVPFCLTCDRFLSHARLCSWWH